MRQVAKLFVGGTAVLLAIALTTSTSFAQEEDLNEADKYMQRGEIKKASASYDRAIRKWPQQVSPAAYAQRARIFIIQKRYPAGLRWIQATALKQHPNSAEIEEQRALMLWAMNQKPDAVAIAKKVVKKKPDAFTNQQILGEWYSQRAQPKQAASALEAYLKHRPSELSKNDVLPRIRLGFAYLSLGQSGNAEKQFNDVLKKHKSRPHAEVNANNGLCAAYTAMGKFDRAIALCEKIIRNPQQIDPVGSVWYNLGQAYLFKKQPAQARKAALNFTKLRRKEPRGFILIGDSYFQEQDWSNALRYYKSAETKAAGRADITASLGIKMGTTYSRLNQPDLAIKKLSEAVANDPKNVRLAVELGSAYIKNKEDDKALTAVDKQLQRKPKDQIDLLVISARALYNLGKHQQAKTRYERAYALRPNETKIRTGLVQTVNYQAFAMVRKNKLADAEKILLQARSYDQKSPLTNRNLAVLALHQNQCDRALGYLSPLKPIRGEAMIYNRLAGRAHECKKKPDLKAASIHYGRAEKLARGRNLVLAEIYTEWAPLLVKTNLEDAKKKLELAVRYSSREQGIAKAAKRNLALVLFRHGWKSMRAGRSSDAYTDFDRAFQDPRLLKGTEPLAFEFSLAIAYLERGDAAKANKIFSRLGKAGNQNTYLKAPYNRVGNQFFAAYANYRSGKANLRRKSAGEFQRLMARSSGSFKRQVRSLLASAYEYSAYDSYRSKNTGSAKKSLDNAAKYATTAAAKRNISHNRAVLAMSGNPGSAAQTFSRMNGNPRESLVNLGIALDRQGKSKEAYQAWARAKSSGVKSRTLNRWIDSKKRIFGY